MEGSFFGFNTSLPGLLDEELHDEPGQGLDEEEEEEYDALNDETFGTDAVEGDWEEDHEKLAEIAEQSRARSGSYGADGGEQGDDSEPDAGLELEASIAQLLVLDDYEEDVIIENGNSRSKLQINRHPAVEEESYSSSAPSGFSVWGPGKHENHLQSTHTVTPSILPVKNVVSLEELERSLLLQQQQHNQRGQPLTQQQHQSQLIVPPPPGLGPPAPSSVLRLEDVERDLTTNATLPHMGRVPPLVHHPDLVMLRNSQDAAAVASMGRVPLVNRLPPGPKPPILPLNRGQMMLPSGRLMGPGGVHPGLPGIPDLRQLPQQNHRLIGSAPNLLRFIPPHLMVPTAQGQGGKGLPHHGGFHGENGLLFPNHPLGAFHPGLPHVDQHRLGGQGSYGPRQDRQGPFFSNNRNGGINCNYQHNRGAYHHHFHNRGSNYSNQDYDEYAGLMTTREKQWLLNIQLLQLNTDRPHIDDYYYTVYQSRQPKSEQDKERERTRDVQRERRDSFREREGPRQDAQPRVYTPAQFENSLGKLQIGSVTAPRKIIDMDVVSPEGMDSVPASTQRDTKKTKQMLLEIERLYLLLLQVEDLSCAVPGIKESVTEEKPVLIQRIMSSLLVDDRIVSIMGIRKGKMLLLRLLPHLPAMDNGPPQLLTVWCRILRSLVAIGRRDQGSDAVLPRFHPYFHSWVATLPFAPILQLVCSMLPSQIERPVSTPTPTRTTSPAGRNVLNYALSNKFGVSALASILNRVEELFESLDSNQQHDWKSFLANLFETAAHISSPEKLPVPLEPLDVTIASQHLGRHECVHIERYALLECIFTRRHSNSVSRDKSNE